MKRRVQRKSLIEYGFELFGWGLVVVHLYRALAFKTIPGLSLSQSNWVFWSIWIACITLGLFLTPKAKRSSLCVFATINTPISIYLVFSYFLIYKTALIIGLSIIGVVLVVYISLVLATNIRDIWRGKYSGKLTKFLASFLHTARMIVGLGLSMIFLVFYLNLYLGRPLMDPIAVATDPKVNNQKISGNIETILLLQEDEWEKLSVQERLDVLQTVANIEATYLGLPHELNVVVAVTDENTSGHYNDGTHTITINPDYIAEESAHDLVETLAHEAFHAYEHRLVDLHNNVSSQERNLLVFDRISEYKENFENYIDGDDDIYGYITQAVETDSIKYAMVAVVDYYSAIEDYLEEGNE